MRSLDGLLRPRQVRPHHQQQDEDQRDQESDQDAQEKVHVPSEADSRQRSRSAKYHPESVGPKKSTAKNAMPRKTPNGTSACIPRPLRSAAGTAMSEPVTAPSSSTPGT